jgi:hypothetical protein
MIHFIQTVFTGRGKPKSEEEEIVWIDRRIKIFKDYTLKSLNNQYIKKFIHWISFRKEHKELPVVKKFVENTKQREEAKKNNHKTVFTFNGQPYFDDKGNNEDLLERFDNDLNIIGDYVNDDVLFTVLDSDDLIHKMFTYEVQHYPFQRRAMYCQKGYIYNIEKDELADWFVISFPAYTLAISREEFLNPKKYINFWREFESHEDIPRVFNAKRMNDNRFCCTVHDKNKSTIWNHPFKGRSYSREDKDRILKDFL